MYLGEVTTTEGGTVLSDAAQWVKDNWNNFLAWESRIVDMQHRAALAAQSYRAQGMPEQEAAAKAMIPVLGELNQLHGKLVDHFTSLAPYVGLGAIALPVAVAAGFSALAIAVLWFLRKAELQESLLEALEAGTLTEAAYLEATRQVDTQKDPLSASLTGAGNLAKWAALAFLAWAALQAFGIARDFQRNPPLMVYKTNPPGLMSERVWHLAYKHTEDGENYIHEFGPGVEMEALDDGSISVYHRNGRPVWREF